MKLDNIERLYACTSSGCCELELTREDANSASHQGACDDDVAVLVDVAYVAVQLAQIDPGVLRRELAEYGAWEDNELQDHEVNLHRFVWLMAGDMVDNDQSGED